ncbi:hypothetical protein HBN50_04590 [Halobacteriovorax sp. GB3]|uniref:hypothetical protein n=1 Tax=Halobacteriovorax sp. GB3 TaxID=2719615 RepID=UPI0023629CDD|nr:hypothetical protein [Halobacteriovorax sp. GB3]MDD0852361.1 hypothetical protein [Halobacteriovorax sp. GB3]
MKTWPVLLVALTLFSSCSLLDKSKVHDQMVNDLMTNGMPLKIEDLKSKLVTKLSDNSFNMDGKLVMVSSNSMPSKYEEKTVEAFRDGFYYKKKIYISTPDFGFDLFTSSKDELLSKLSKNKVHILIDKKDHFLIVKDNRVYEGKAINKNNSSLNVYRITRYIRGYNVDLNWIGLLKGKFPFSVEEGPVLFEESFKKYKVIERSEILSTYFRVLPEKANKEEEQLLKAL